MDAHSGDRALPDRDLDRPSAISRRPASAGGGGAGDQPVAAAGIVRRGRDDVQRSRRDTRRARGLRLRRRRGAAVRVPARAHAAHARRLRSRDGAAARPRLPPADSSRDERRPSRARALTARFRARNRARRRARPARRGVCESRRGRAHRGCLSAARRRSSSRAAAVVRRRVAARRTGGQRVVCDLVRRARLPRLRHRLPARAGGHVARANPGRALRARMGAGAQRRIRSRPFTHRARRPLGGRAAGARRRLSVRRAARARGRQLLRADRSG